MNGLILIPNTINIRNIVDFKFYVSRLEVVNHPIFWFLSKYDYICLKQELPIEQNYF